MELGFESLRSRRWFRRLCCMFKIMKDQAPEYLNNLIPKRNQNFKFRNIYIPSYNCLTEYFKSSFFPASLEEWFHLDPSIRNSETINAFKQILLAFIRPRENSNSNIFDSEGLKLLTRLRLGFGHLNEHRFRHNFQERLNPLCTRSLETECTSYCLLHCHCNTPFCTDLTNSVKTFVLDFSPYEIVKKLKFFYMETLSAKIIKIILFYQLL